MRFALFVHSSQQREERTKKRRRGYRAFGFVTMVAVGVCGTRFARTVLALWALPLYSLVGTQGERGLTLLLPLQVFLIPLLVATLLSSPLYFALQNAGEEGNTSFRNEVGYRSFFFAVL